VWIQVRYRKGLLSQRSAIANGHKLLLVKLKLRLSLALTITDTGGAVLTLMLGYTKIITVQLEWKSETCWRVRHSNQKLQLTHSMDFCDSGPLREQPLR